MAYSKNVVDWLNKNGVAQGDCVRVENGKLVFEGVLLPRASFGDENILVIKLDSGYNTGVSFASTAKITKLASTGIKFEAKKSVLAQARLQKNLPQLAFVGTGGTISTRVNYALGGVSMQLSAEQVYSAVPELASIAQFKHVSTPFTIASEDMTPREWLALAKELASKLNDKDVSGAVVTHGTDTMGFSAAALSFMLRGLTKPVALVGSQRSPDRGSSDAAMNLICGTHFACSGYPGVAVVMHGSSSDDYCIAHKGTKVRKMHSTRRDAFKTINDEPVARIWKDGRIEFTSPSTTVTALPASVPAQQAKENKAITADAVFEEKTALLKLFPGASPDLLTSLIDSGYKGVVLEAFALGHVPTKTLDSKDSWLPAVKRAVDKGVFVAVTTQCYYGRVNAFVYENLRALHQAGAVHCEDILPETAYVKLGWVLGHKPRSLDEVKNKMLENIAGEYNPRLTEEEFY